jgi:3',5'-cyclic AMP phosphodiesterase CpdA
MDLSILHISDLHRDTKSRVANGPLLESLLADRNRYTVGMAAIREPDLIVVSGDIVYGVDPREGDGSEAALRDQYKEATEFLEELTTQFVGGDKRRIVIVPGNHDVDASRFFRSLSVLEIEPGKSIEIARQLMGLY